jgi:hypothetical protein
MVFAINSGLVDGNGNNIGGNNHSVSYLKTTLEKLPAWPCDDVVDLEIHYTLTFTQMT